MLRGKLLFEIDHFMPSQNHWPSSPLEEFSGGSGVFGDAMILVAFAAASPPQEART